ncbi:hypothetical protein RchiOBHm_Chr7g0230001 [Rosa chinensis]|uniref:Uncharacterized protein n=1 Tax=Rosa chinensis TaxID=74649 RepID=A0A2P6PFA2_ROSCH|nr:hypothetical protein RchiOBHm_Chr7g0230001 [Rosa chinensis]
MELFQCSRQVPTRPFAFNLTNLFVFTPMTIEILKKWHKVEREQNIGEEVGCSKNVQVAKVNRN